MRALVSGVLVSVGCSAFASSAGEGVEPGKILDAGPPTDSGPSDGGPVLLPPRIIARTSAGLRGLAVDATRVYFANEATGEVRSALKSGDSDDAPSTLLASGYAPTDLAADATRVYWIERAPNGTMSSSHAYKTIAKDGTDPVNAPNYFESSRLTVSAGHVHTVSRLSNAVWYLLRDGVDSLAEFGFDSPPKAVVWNGVTVFYERSGVLDTYPKPDLDGGAAFAIAPASDLAVDETTVYWITTLGTVQSLASDRYGDAPTDLATGISGPARIAVDSESVYVTAWGIGPATGKVLRIPKVGGPAVELATGLAEPWGIAVDAAGVYVANHGDGTVLALPRVVRP